LLCVCVSIPTTMASQQGIQQLLQAEQRAQEIIAKARKEKTTLLKAAKDEADKEVAAFRASKDGEFQDYIRKHAGTTDEYTKQLEEETQRQINDIAQLSNSHVPEVIQLLLKAVTDVSITVPTK